MVKEINMDEPHPNTDQNQNNQSTDQQSAPEFDIQAFEATRAIATRQTQRLQELKTELKLFASQLKSLLENDSQLATVEQEAKSLNNKIKTRKAEIFETSEAKNIKLKIADLKEERSDIEDSLSNHLFDLYQTTGVMEFEDTAGHIWEYNIKAKIKTMKNN